MEQHTSRRDWLLAASIIAGSAVRLYQLSEQIIADEEEMADTLSNALPQVVENYLSRAEHSKAA